MKGNKNFKGKAIYNPSGKAGEYSYWACNSLLHNAWEDEEHKACNDLTLKLAKRVIEILEK